MVANKQNLSRALLCCVSSAALFLGVGSALPLWWVPCKRAYYGTRFAWEGGCGIRAGTLWESIAGTVGLSHSYNQGWQFENLVVGLGFLAAGAVAGLLCYWVVWARTTASVCTSPDPHPPTSC